MELEHIHKKEIAKHDNRYIHEVVRNQNRCQQTFAVVQQITDFLIRRMRKSVLYVLHSVVCRIFLLFVSLCRMHR